VRTAAAAERAIAESAKHEGTYVIEVAVDPELKAEYARMRDDGAFLLQVREQLKDLLPSELRPSDIRRLVALDVDNDGMLSADELIAARKVLSSMDSKDRPQQFLAKLRTGQLFKSPVLTSVKQVLQPLSPSPFEIAPAQNGEAPSSELHVVGTVANVIEAHLPEELRNKVISAAPYKTGFEAAAIDDVESMGEMCLKDGVVYIRSTDEASPDFFKTRKGDAFLSSGAILVPNEAKAAYNALLRRRHNPDGLSFVRVVNDLFTTVKGPFLFAGEMQFAKCDVTCIARPPIHGDRLPDHIDRYYWQPGAVMHGVRAYIVGAVAREAGDDDPPLESEVFHKVFYKPVHPETSAEAQVHGEVSRKLHCHAHVVTCTGGAAPPAGRLAPQPGLGGHRLQP